MPMNVVKFCKINEKIEKSLSILYLTSQCFMKIQVWTVLITKNKKQTHFYSKLYL